MTSMDDTQSKLVRKHGFWFYLRRISLGFVVVVILLIGAGLIYETIAESSDRNRLSPAGRLIDMGGYELHLYCSGTDNTNDLAVILESGLAGTTSNWARIQSELSATTRVCSYDRGGIGWSDRTPQPRDAIGVAHELHELLQRGGISGRLLLVGHSSGGLYVRTFRALYPERVVGMALLDSSHEDQFTRMQDGMSLYRRILNAYTILPWAAKLGIIRLSSLCDLPTDFPPAARDNFRSSCSRADSWKAQKLEHASLLSAMAQVKAQPKLDALPLVVVTAGNDSQNPSNWLELQKELGALSTNGRHIVRANATHPGLLLDLDDAHQCSLAITEMIDSVRLAQNKP